MERKMLLTKALENCQYEGIVDHYEQGPNHRPQIKVYGIQLTQSDSSLISEILWQNRALAKEIAKKIQIPMGEDLAKDEGYLKFLASEVSDGTYKSGQPLSPKLKKEMEEWAKTPLDISDMESMVLGDCFVRSDSIIEF